MILAGIDIGTNTLRLLIAEQSAPAFREIHSDRKITRLGQDLDRTGEISFEARNRSVAALAEFSKSIIRCKAGRVSAVGTSALRNASNSAEFIDEVRRKTGIEIRIISGEEEARLTLLGASYALKGRNAGAAAGMPRQAVLIDIGGGSTELIFMRPGDRIREVSLPLGAVYLTERFLRKDPPSAEEIEQVRQSIRNELRRQVRIEDVSAGAALIGTAGTVTTLAAMDLRLSNYDPERINGAILSRESIGRIIDRLAGAAVKDRLGLPGLEPGREDIILAGALICMEIMALFRFSGMQVSDWGLREGIILDMCDTLKNSRNFRELHT